MTLHTFTLYSSTEQSYQRVLLSSMLSSIIEAQVILYVLLFYTVLYNTPSPPLHRRKVNNV